MFINRMPLMRRRRRKRQGFGGSCSFLEMAGLLLLFNGVSRFFGMGNCLPDTSKARKRVDTRENTIKDPSSSHMSIPGMWKARKINDTPVNTTGDPSPSHVFNQKLYDSYPCQSWVYAMFSSWREQDWESWLTFYASRKTLQRFHAFNLENQLSFPFPEMKDCLVGSATAVLHRRFYVIGGENEYRGAVSNQVSFCDPSASYEWSSATPTRVPRRNAAATSAYDGRLYVFGGRSKSLGKAPKVPFGQLKIIEQERALPEPLERKGKRFDDTIPWAEMYDPSTNTWTDLPGCDDPPLQPLVAVALRNRIFIRGGGKGKGTGIGLDLSSLRWSRLPDELLRLWRVNSNAAAVNGMLITTSQRIDEVGQETEGDHEHFIAYHADRQAWLRIEGPRISYYQNAMECHIFSLNSNLVICDMIRDWRRSDNVVGFRFSVFGINEVTENSVLVNFVSEWIPFPAVPRPAIPGNFYLAIFHGCPAAGQ